MNELIIRIAALLIGASICVVLVMVTILMVFAWVAAVALVIPDGWLQYAVTASPLIGLVLFVAGAILLEH